MSWRDSRELEGVSGGRIKEAQPRGDERKDLESRLPQRLHTRHAFHRKPRAPLETISCTTEREKSTFVTKKSRAEREKSETEK